MRKQVLLVLALLLNSLMFAQGGGFNYKALITNGGSALSNQAVDIKFTVLENGTTNVYQEKHPTTTDANGIVSTIVGEGNTISGDFTTISWGHNPYFLKVEIDSGSGYQDFGTNELKAVPYAKFADKAASVDYNNLTNVPTGLDDADFYKAGTTTQPTDINDNIYTMGNVAIGKNTADYPLDIVSNTSVRGVNLELSTGGNIQHYGVYNSLSGTGTGAQFSVFNTITNTGNAEHFGSYSLLIGSGSGMHCGSFNALLGAGTGKQYGVRNYISNSGNNTHYGSYSKLNGTGSGDKYGTYNKIENTAGGTHYAVYGEAKKSGSYAGYFDGDVQMTQKLKANDSGDTDMKAYIYGAINYAGSFGAGAHSDGFAVSKIGTGHYKITFTNSPGDTHLYTVMTNMRFNAIGFITVKNYASYFEIKTYNTSGNPANKGFNFVVYKK